MKRSAFNTTRLLAGTHTSAWGFYGVGNFLLFLLLFFRESGVWRVCCVCVYVCERVWGTITIVTLVGVHSLRRRDRQQQQQQQKRVRPPSLSSFARDGTWLVVILLVSYFYLISLKFSSFYFLLLSPPTAESNEKCHKQTDRVFLLILKKKKKNGNEENVDFCVCYQIVLANRLQKKVKEAVDLFLMSAKKKWPSSGNCLRKRAPCSVWERRSVEMANAAAFYNQSWFRHRMQRIRLIRKRTQSEPKKTARSRLSLISSCQREKKGGGG